jgi:hypothetical protein
MDYKEFIRHSMPLIVSAMITSNANWNVAANEMINQGLAKDGADALAQLAKIYCDAIWVQSYKSPHL